MAGNKAGDSQEAVLNRFHEHQKDAARISVAEEARLIVSMNRTGVLSTIGASGAAAGYPTGSVVEYVADSAGNPLLAVSSLSNHTRDVSADPRCSLTITAPNFKGMADARLTLVGSMLQLTDSDQAAARETYLQANPGSFWVDFGDFSWFKLQLLEGRFNGGFARAAKISREEYSEAQVDPVAPFSFPIAKHMNDDHADSTRQMVEHYARLPAESAKIVDLDRLGLNIVAQFAGDSISCRLPYPRPATDRKDIKTLIVEMTRAAAAAAAPISS